MFGPVRFCRISYLTAECWGVKSVCVWCVAPAMGFNITHCRTKPVKFQQVWFLSGGPHSYYHVCSLRFWRSADHLKSCCGNQPRIIKMFFCGDLLDFEFFRSAVVWCWNFWMNVAFPQSLSCCWSINSDLSQMLPAVIQDFEYRKCSHYWPDYVSQLKDWGSLNNWISW